MEEIQNLHCVTKSINTRCIQLSEDDKEGEDRQIHSFFGYEQEFGE